MADLDSCVRRVLCGLSDTALRALQGLIDGQVAILQAQIAVYQAQILQYDVLAIPVEIAANAAQTVVDQVREAAYLVPLNLIADCADLGYFNLNLTQSIDVAVSTAEDAIFEATRLLSFRDELNAIVSELNGIIDQFTDIRSVIDECIARV